LDVKPRGLPAFTYLVWYLPLDPCGPRGVNTKFLQAGLAARLRAFNECREVYLTDRLTKRFKQWGLSFEVLVLVTLKWGFVHFKCGWDIDALKVYGRETSRLFVSRSNLR